jgi:hypothetical protein
LRKFTTGPDEIDVMAMIQAISTVHSGRVEVVLQQAGIGFTPRVAVICRATFDVLDGSHLPVEVKVENGYPCAEHSGIWSHIYDGLYRLDAAIQAAYEQAELPDPK